MFLLGNEEIEVRFVDSTTRNIAVRLLRFGNVQKNVYGHSISRHYQCDAVIEKLKPIQTLLHTATADNRKKSQ